MPKKCTECGNEHTRRKSTVCSKKCSDARYRSAHPEKVRQAVRDANSRRYVADPAFREAKKAETRRWRSRIRQRIAGQNVANTAKGVGVYRSLMEARIVPALLQSGARYEPVRLRYTGKPRGYVPDVVLPNGIVIEIKGWFTSQDRAKLLAVKAAFPALDLRLVLASPRQKLSRESNTTQAGWCDRHDFAWADNDVPSDWLEEPHNSESLSVIKTAADTKGKTARKERNEGRRRSRLEEPACEGDDA